MLRTSAVQDCIIAGGCWLHVNHAAGHKTLGGSQFVSVTTLQESISC